MSLNTILADMKQRLAALPTIVSCKVGIESNLAPKDYPAIRIVPDQIKRKDSVSRTAEVRIYAGLPLVESKVGLESVISQLIDMEETIVTLVQEGNDYRSIHTRTLMSSPNEVEHYQLICIFLEVGWMV